MRLIDGAYGLDPESKVCRCAEKIMEIYENTRDTQAIQMVFCDSSTPKAGFNLYDELKTLLKAMGMPENRIAFIHDADTEDRKKLLFRDLCKGLISVVVGSTFKMGLGVNVQERLCALHHLDVPWRPADMVQREGRILRQGNTCSSVQIYRYVTRGSFDAYSWQLLETKQRFISQILSGKVCCREGDDVDETILNYAEVKALAVGNPLIKHRVEIINELDKYKILHQEFMEDRARKRRQLESLPEQIETQLRSIENARKDIDDYAANKSDYKAMSYPEQKAIRDAIFDAVRTHVNMPFEKHVLSYQGFDVVVPARMQPRHPAIREAAGENVAAVHPIPYVFVRRNGSYCMDIESHAGITKRLNNLLENLDRAKSRQEGRLQELYNLKQNLEAELNKSEASYAQQIQQLQDQLEELDEKLGVSAA